MSIDSVSSDNCMLQFNVLIASGVCPWNRIKVFLEFVTKTTMDYNYEQTSEVEALDSIYYGDMQSKSFAKEMQNIVNFVLWFTKSFLLQFWKLSPSTSSLFR